MEWKDNLKNVITKAFSDVEKEYNNLLHLKEVAHSQYVEEVERVKAAQEKYNVIKESVDSELKKLNQEREIHRENLQKISDIETREIVAQMEIADVKKNLEVLRRESENAKAELDKYTNLVEQVKRNNIDLDASIKQLGYITSQISEKSIEIVQLEEKITKLKSDALSARDKADKASAQRLKEIDDIYSDVRAREEILFEKEKRLIQKESDLKTIEGRWTKLFGEKGIKFKI